MGFTVEGANKSRPDQVAGLKQSAAHVTVSWRSTNPAGGEPNGAAYFEISVCAAVTNRPLPRGVLQIVSLDREITNYHAVLPGKIHAASCMVGVTLLHTTIYTTWHALRHV